MEFILNIFYVIFITFIGVLVTYLSSGLNKHDRTILVCLYFFHQLMGIIFCFYTMKQNGDATGYWKRAMTDSPAEILHGHMGAVTNFVTLLCYPFAHLLRMNFIVGSILFSTFGYFGFMYAYKLVQMYMPDTSILKRIRLFGIQLFPLVLFLPNLNIWSSGIGKDSLQLFCVTYLIYAVHNIRQKWFYITLAAALLIGFRPHILLMLLMAIAIGYILDGKSNIYKKAALSIVSLVGGIFLINFVASKFHISVENLNEINEYAKQKNEILQTGGSSIDMSGYPIPLKMFTFMFRPLIFDAHNVLALVISIEDIFVLFILFKMLRRGFLWSFRRTNFIMKSIFLFVMIGSALFPFFVGGNLMLLVRQRTPFTLMLLVFCLYCCYCRKYVFIKRAKEKYQGLKSGSIAAGH